MKQRSYRSLKSDELTVGPSRGREQVGQHCVRLTFHYISPSSGVSALRDLSPLCSLDSSTSGSYLARFTKFQ